MIHSFLLSFDLNFLLWIACNQIYFILFYFILLLYFILFSTHDLTGGENISSIQVEAILLTHHLIDEAAVIAYPDEKWGEVPCAFITLREGSGSVILEDCYYCIWVLLLNWIIISTILLLLIMIIIGTISSLYLIICF